MLDYNEEIAISVFNQKVRDGMNTKDAAKIAWQGARDFAKAHQQLRLEDREFVSWDKLEVGKHYKIVDGITDFEGPLIEKRDDSITMYSEKYNPPTCTFSKRDFLNFNWKVVE